MSVDAGLKNGRAGSVDRDTALDVQDFLNHEAQLVDDRRFDEWLDLFDEGLEYRVPVRVWRDDAGQQVDTTSCIISDTKPTLSIRVQRIGTGFAWSETPPSVTRHFVSNVRVMLGPGADEFTARCNLLVARNRGTAIPVDTITADRVDVLRRDRESFLITRRTVTIDAVNPRVNNLAIFF